MFDQQQSGIFLPAEDKRRRMGQKVGRVTCPSTHPLSGILPSREELERLGRRRHQHPSVLKTKAKRPQWYIRVMVEVIVDRNETERKEDWVYLGFCDEIGIQEAKKIRDEKLKSINNLPFFLYSQVPFQDLAEAYRRTHIAGLKPSSRTGYEHCLDKYILTSFKDFRLFEVDAMTIQRWVYDMESDGPAIRTRRKVLAVLRSLFEMAEEYGYFQGRNPCKKTKLGNGGDVYDRRPLEPEEALKLLSVLEGEEPLRTMVEVAMFTNLRISELRGLTWGAVDGQRNTLEVKQSLSQQDETAGPKSANSGRKLDLGNLKGKLVRPAGAKATDLVWGGDSYFALQKRLKVRAARAGIDFHGFGFHTLRRSYCDWRDRLRIGEKPDAGTVKDMGHADGRVTKHYVTGMRTGIVERLQELVFFSGKAETIGERMEEIGTKMVN